MVDLTRLLPKLLRANGGNPELAVKLAWSRAAGPGLRRQAIPVRLEGKILIVAVGDALWQKQLRHMGAELIYRINNLLGQSLVDAIAFRIDPAVTSAAAEDSRAAGESKKSAPAPTELLFAAGSIADQDLRDRFIRAAENCIARRDARASNPSPKGKT